MKKIRKKVIMVTMLIISMVSALLFSLNINNKNAVVAFLDSLESEQLKKVRFSFDDVSRYSWHYFPDNWWERQGIQIKELNKKQKDLLFQMLKGFLSEEGYAKTQKIIDLENVLAEIEKNPKIRNPENYFIAIYGNPRKDTLWAWSFEGHHISLNYTILNNKIHVSPRFFGADPAIILQGKRKGERTLEREEDIAYELMNELTEQQKQKAIFRSISLRNIVTSNKQKVKPLKPVGIKASALNAMQKSKLKQLIAVYINALPKDIALLREYQIFQEEFDAIRFAWAGKTIRGVPHYYRIQGKSFLIELANTQNNANHIHSVWRDFNGDFGRDIMKEHYQTYHKND